MGAQRSAGRTIQLRTGCALACCEEDAGANHSSWELGAQNAAAAIAARDAQLTGTHDGLIKGALNQREAVGKRRKSGCCERQLLVGVDEPLRKEEEVGKATDRNREIWLNAQVCMCP